MGLEISFNTKPAVSFMSISFDREIVDEINEYLDENVIPQNIDASGNLVGQIKKNEKSSQLIFPHDDGDVGEQFSNYIERLANQYMSNSNQSVVTDEAGVECNINISGGEDRKYDPQMKSMWIVRSFEGDYNPEHDHPSDTDIALSCILYLKVPSQIAGKVEIPNWGEVDVSDSNGSLYNASGIVDGYTRFTWGNNTWYDMKKLKPSTEQYIKPEIGRMIMFPSWLHHSVLPFFGEGERRTLSANINIVEK